MNVSPTLASRPRFLTIIPLAAGAGIVGAALTTAELFFTTVMPVHGSLAALFRDIARVACGPNGVPFDALLFGILTHLFVSIVWAYGYADLDVRTAALSRAPIVSGIVFGLLVFLGMQSILLSVHQFHTFTPLAFLNNIVLHTLFFGIPIALIVARFRNASA